MNDLKSRLMAHSVGAFLVIISILFARMCYFRPFFTLLIALIAIVSLKEFYLLLDKRGLRPALRVGSLFSFLYIFAVFLDHYFEKLFLPQIIIGVAFFAFFLAFWAKEKRPLTNIPTSFFGFLYIAIPFSLIIRITYDFPAADGTFWLALLIIVTKFSDMGGYFLGKSFGKKKLAPKISPKKTWLGAFGATLSSVIAALILCFFRNHFLQGNGSYLLFAILGVALGVVAQLGDLAESLFKRDVEVKDSNKIPGIGGVLDVVDSLLFTAPFLFIFLKFYYNG